MLWLQLEPSTVRKIGSWPWVSENRCWTWLAETDMPSLGWWQLPQDRPLVPKLWKNGPVRSMPPPVVLWVSDAPPGFPKNVPLGMKVICCPLSATMATSVATARKTALMMTSLYRRLSADPFAKNRDVRREKLDCRAGKVCIETPLTAPTAPVCSLFTLGEWDRIDCKTTKLVT